MDRIGGGTEQIDDDQRRERARIGRGMIGCMGAFVVGCALLALVFIAGALLNPALPRTGFGQMAARLGCAAFCIAVIPLGVGFAQRLPWARVPIEVLTWLALLGSLAAILSTRYGVQPEDAWAFFGGLLVSNLVLPSSAVLLLLLHTPQVRAALCEDAAGRAAEAAAHEDAPGPPG